MVVMTGQLPVPGLSADGLGSEHELARRYADRLSASGARAVSRLYRVQGLAQPFLWDVFLPEKNALIEANSTDRRDAIRMAIGQLLDYEYLEGTQPPPEGLAGGRDHLQRTPGHLGLLPVGARRARAHGRAALRTRQLAAVHEVPGLSARMIAEPAVSLTSRRSGEEQYRT
jgi:hypothetical protein